MKRVKTKTRAQKCFLEYTLSSLVTRIYIANLTWPGIALVLTNVIFPTWGTRGSGGDQSSSLSLRSPPLLGLLLGKYAIVGIDPVCVQSPLLKFMVWITKGILDQV